MSANDKALNDSLDLILRYAGGDCTDEEFAELTHRLSTSEQARDEMCDLALEAIAVSEQQTEMIAGQLPEAEPRCSGLENQVARLWYWPVSLAAAVVVLAMLGFSYFAAHSDSEIVRASNVAGSVRWTGNGGAVVNELPENARLTGGVIETLSDDAAVTLTFLDGSRITLVGDSKATLSDLNRQKKVHLSEGNLSADIQQQLTDKPFLIATPTADLEVVGTRFEVDSFGTSTVLAVNEGAVRLTRRVDGSVVDVPAEHQVVASLSSEDELEPQQRGEFIYSWTSTLNTKPMGAEGQWLPATEDSAPRLRAVAKLSTRKNGQPRMVHRVKLRINGNTPQPLQLQAGTTVRIHGRLAKPSRVTSMLGTAGPRGGYAGNYFYSERPTSHEQWTMEFDLSQLEPQRVGNFAASPEGLVLNCIILYTRGADVGLEIEGVEVIGESAR